jgi:DNA-binding MarR family transcriptional regulator
MSPEEVARAHQFREGFTLVDYGEVGLPVFRLTIEAITTTQRTLPTIHEFVMRCLSLGESREETIARMLGLRPEVVVGAVNALVAEGLVARQSGSSDLQSFGLTEAGEARLAVESIEVPQEEMLVIDYDGVRRLPIRLAGAAVVKAAELKLSGALEIRPYPAEAPAIDTLAIHDITRVVRRQRGEDFRRTVLALKRIVRRNNVFSEAVALVFAADKGGEVQVAFAIDGKLSELHERAFAENGGPKKMGFLKALSESDSKSQIDAILGKQTAKAFPPRADVITLRRVQSDAEAVVRNTVAAAERGGKGNPASAALAMAQQNLVTVEAMLANYPVRPMEVYEQKDLLDEALNSAKTRLLITSNALNPTLLHGGVLRQIDNLIGLGVAVRIQIPAVPTSDAGKNEVRYDPRSELAKRSHRGSPVLMEGRKRSIYFLLKDRGLAVVTNRPFFGDPFRRSGFVFVSGTVIRDPEMVEKLYQKLTEPAVRKRG